MGSLLDCFFLFVFVCFICLRFYFISTDLIILVFGRGSHRRHECN